MNHLSDDEEGFSSAISSRIGSRYPARIDSALAGHFYYHISHSQFLNFDSLLLQYFLVIGRRITPAALHTVKADLTSTVVDKLAAHTAGVYVLQSFPDGNGSTVFTFRGSGRRVSHYRIFADAGWQTFKVGRKCSYTERCYINSDL
jgi:hypothetical protein